MYNLIKTSMKWNANIIEHKVDGKQQSVTRIEKNHKLLFKEEKKVYISYDENASHCQWSLREVWNGQQLSLYVHWLVRETTKKVEMRSSMWMYFYLIT